jgi:DNA repair exonuclease SbcCD ATPase subunit
MLLAVVVGIAFFAIVVVLIIYGVRRSTRMSPELSKEWEAKLKAIKQPTTTIPKESRTREEDVATPQPPARKGDQIREVTPQTTFHVAPPDYKTELQHPQQEIATLNENESSSRNEIAALRTEISTLRERLQNSQDEVQELRTSIQQNIKKQVETENRNVEAETSMHNEITNLRTEISSLQERLVNSLKEIQELKASTEQNVKPLQANQKQAAILEANLRKEIDGLRNEISTLQERIETGREEIGKLRTTIDQGLRPRTVSQPAHIQAEHIQEVEPEEPEEQPRRGRWGFSLFGRNAPIGTCPNCKRTIRPKDRFCDHCGQVLR